ncbi:MAG: helicase HerA domain-containing protein [Nitrososphaerales archaeon]
MKEIDDKPGPLIGFVASLSGATTCTILLVEGLEDKVREETFVMVKDRGRWVLGVIRAGTGIDDNLQAGRYSPGIAYAKKGHAPSSARRSFYYTFSVIGQLKDNGLEENRQVIRPGSQAYLVQDRNPFSAFKQGDYLWAGNYWECEDWEIPFHKDFIPYHIGVYGATGCGKSFLTRFLLIPLLKQAGYGVLALDWEGRDYARHMPKNTVLVSQVKMDIDTVITYICSRANHFGYYGYQRENNRIRQAIEHVLRMYESDKESWRMKSEFELGEWLESEVKQYLEISEGKRADYLQMYKARLTAGLQRIEDKHWATILGKMEPKDLVAKAKSEGLLILDMAAVGTDEKLAFFKSLGGHIRERLEEGEELNLALIIDEGPQYAPWQPRGIQIDTTDLIQDLCALGRKHRLSVTIIAQGMAGDIGINAAIRRNLNTHFIGQIHPLDMEEAGNWLNPYHIPVDRLLRMEPGQFYFIGKMNPSPTPLLISFKISD